jgi:hypothetical protein
MSHDPKPSVLWSQRRLIALEMNEASGTFFKKRHRGLEGVWFASGMCWRRQIKGYDDMKCLKRFQVEKNFTKFSQ